MCSRGGLWEPGEGKGEGEDQNKSREDVPRWRGLEKPPPPIHSMSGDNPLSLSLSAAPSFEHGLVGHGDGRRTDNITHLTFLLVLLAGKVYLPALQTRDDVSGPAIRAFLLSSSSAPRSLRDVASIAGCLVEAASPRFPQQREQHWQYPSFHMPEQFDWQEGVWFDP